MYEALYVDAVARLHPDLALALSSMPSNAGTPVGTVLEGTWVESSVAIAEMLHETMSECRRALEYAAPEAPGLSARHPRHVHRRAGRVMGRKVVGTADSLEEPHPGEGDRVDMTVAAIAQAALLRGAQKRLDRIEEIRDAHTLAAGGLTHREIVDALLTTQPRVSRLLREGGSPEVGPEEVILRAAVDGSDRAALVQELSRMEHTFGEHDPTGGGGYRRGTWDDVQSAAGQGLLTAEEYDAVLSAVVPTREDR